MGLVTAHYVRRAYQKNQCQNFIVYGMLGIGKTSYTLQVLMEVYKKEIEKDGLIQTIDKYFFHTPIELLQKMRKIEQRVPAVGADDFGVYLYSLDYSKPLVKSIVKYFQMGRTKTSALIMTTPTPTLILGKLRCFPQTITIKVATPPDSPSTPYANLPSPNLPYRYMEDLRYARAYRSWLLPDLMKLRIKKLYEDDFSCLLPTELYNWCNEKRKTYIKILEEEIEKNLPKGMKEIKQMEAIV